MDDAISAGGVALPHAIAADVGKLANVPESEDNKVTMTPDHKTGRLVIDFGRPMQTLNLTADEARAMAKTMRQAVNQVDPRKKAGKQRGKRRRR